MHRGSAFKTQQAEMEAQERAGTLVDAAAVRETMTSAVSMSESGF